MFALAGCGPPVPGYTVSAFPTPTPTGRATGGTGTGPPGEPSTDDSKTSAPSTSPGSTTASPTTPDPTPSSPTSTSASPTTTQPHVPCSAEIITPAAITSAVPTQAALTPEIATTTSPQTPSTATTQSPDIVPALADFTVAAVSECSVAPGVAENAPDCLLISVDLRNEGADTPEAASVLVSLRSDTGLNRDVSLAATTESKPQTVRVNVGPSAFERVHTFTIKADPTGTIPEVNEGNNSVEVKVALPARGAVIQGEPCAAEGSAPVGGA
ncbi:CARDB domain-containing protein [Arthrobacter sp. ZGTC131]|uniref:CARDB domain-containing protein n=1 Tax=Arthrobacter sp. ZGTC131 TaxID=2058898 RepID=UPI0034D77585